MGELLTVSEAAALLHTSEHFVRRLVAERRSSSKKLAVTCASVDRP